MPDGVVNLVDDSGRSFAVPYDQVADALNRGFRVETAQDAASRVSAAAREQAYGGFGGGIATGLAGLGRGLSLGATDVAAAELGYGDTLLGLQEVNPGISTASEIVGSVAGGLAAPESLLSSTPAGLLSKGANAVGEAIPGAGALARVGRLAATGATEGAVSNAGQYIGQMALQDKDLAAEGLLASFRDGALYGGGAAGALGIAGEGLVAARRLIPEAELNPVAVRRAREAAKQEVSTALEDTKDLEKAARSKARQMREEWIAADAARRAELDSIAIAKAKEIADAQTAAARAKTAKLEAEAQTAKDVGRAKVEAAEARAERAKNPPKRTRRGEVPAEEATVPAPEAPPGSVGDDIDQELMRQLQGTKSAIDNGEDFAALSVRRKEQAIEDALNRRVAQESPEMDRLLRHLDGLSGAREQVASWLDKYPSSKVKSFEYQEGMRKPSGWVETVPKGEGSVGMPRGRQFELRGGDVERAAFEGKVARGDLHRIAEDPLSSAAEKAAAERALTLPAEEQAAALADLQAKRTARQIVGASDDAAPASVDDHVARALDGHADLADDVDDATDAISALESTTADLAEELGPDAPPMSQQRARAYRQQQAGVDESAAKSAESAMADAERAAQTIGLGDASPAAKRGAGLLQKAEHVGQMLEALQMLGVPVPDSSRIPVVGPLLSMYLKAKLASRALKGLGGKVPRTAETEIARRANDTKAKLMRAADKALETTARAVTSKAASRAAGATAATVLSAKLFDDRDPMTKEKKTAPSTDLGTIYLARKDELERAMAPDAIRESVRKRVRTTDVGMIDAIAVVEERKLKFLYDKMPKIDGGVSLLGGRATKTPSRVDIDQWSKYVAAAQDPAGTLGRMLNGDLVSSEAGETIRTVAPRLLQDVQQRIVERAAELGPEVPYRKRVALSMSLGIPLDDSQTPDAMMFFSQAGQQTAQQPMAPPMGGQPMMSPTMISDVAAPERVNPETRI